ncbi:MAG: hypothetical protein AB8B50_13660 [Pirellulaceae bacterium]
MKCLHIQLQPALYACDVEPIVDELTAIATDAVPNAVVAVERGDDDGPYINIQSDACATLWASVSAHISSNPNLASSAIVCCEGDNGWYDYLLLHHYDRGEPLDVLS